MITNDVPQSVIDTSKLTEEYEVPLTLEDISGLPLNPLNYVSTIQSYIIPASSSPDIQDVFEAGVSGYNGLFGEDMTEYFISFLQYPFDLFRYIFGHTITTTEWNNYRTELFNRDGSSALNSVYGILYNTSPTDANGYNLRYASRLIAEEDFTSRGTSFLDFEPYTKVEMYLPFLGFCTLPTQQVIGHKVQVIMTLDVMTGQVLYYTQNEECIFDMQSTSVGVNVPIGATRQDSGQDALSTIATTFSGLAATMGSILTGHIAAGTALLGGTLMNTTVNVANTYRAHPGSGQLGNSSGVLKSIAPQYVYFIITKPKVAYPSLYNHLVGRPCLKTYDTLSELTGYTKVQDVHIQNIPRANKQEQELIKQKLLNGVIIS